VMGSPSRRYSQKLGATALARFDHDDVGDRAGDGQVAGERTRSRTPRSLLVFLARPGGIEPPTLG